jgi:capsular exopolysaccharide synthesis family protein
MSKNFEVLQQMEELKQIGSVPIASGLPGSLPDHSRVNGVRDAHGLDIEKLAQEETLKLVQRVFLMQSERQPRVVIFASVDPRSGCSRTCACVARNLAEHISGSVCVVEANLRSPALPGYFGVSNHFGLTDALLQDGAVRDFMKPVGRDNLWLLSSGSLAADSQSLLKGDRLKQRIEELRKEFDYVLIDAPPLSLYADAASVGQLTDGLVLILEANMTRRETARRVIEAWSATKVPILGAVLNNRTFPIPESLYRRM